MATRKKTSPRPSRSSTSKNKGTAYTEDYALSQDEVTSYDQENTETNSSFRKPQFTKIALVVLVVAALAALLFRNRSWFVAATVNGQPIPRWELTSRLTERFGAQVLDSMIGERLITGEAQKQGVSVSEADLTARIAEIEGTLQGQMKLDDALKLQGVSREEFESQVKVQLLIDKMLAKDVSVSAQEVDDFVKNNAGLLTASESAQQRAEAESQIKSNKISEKFQEWFATLKNNAKINTFIK